VGTAAVEVEIAAVEVEIAAVGVEIGGAKQLRWGLRLSRLRLPP